MTEEEKKEAAKQELLKNVKAEAEKVLKENAEGFATSEEIETAVKDAVDKFKGETEMTYKEVVDALKEQGEALAKFKVDEVKTEKTMAVALKESMEDIKSIAKRESSKELIIKVDTVRASIASNTQSYNLPDIGQLAHRKLTIYDIFRKFPVRDSNNNGTIRYWDWDSATTVRAAATRAEGAAFPESTAKWVLGTIPLEKIGDTLPISEEFFQDEEMFAAELSQFLETNVAIALDTQLATGNGTSPNLKGIFTTVGAYTPVASGISDASIYDLLVKVSESITNTGGSKYTPDVALMNISDINKMKLKKDANENYVLPPFVSRDGKSVDSIIVMECNSIAANTMVVGDRRYARIYEKGGVELSRGHVGDQFTEDMMTLKARKRAAFLIRGADLGGFAKVTSISAALTTLAS